MAGKRARCKRCNASLRVPAAPAPKAARRGFRLKPVEESVLAAPVFGSPDLAPPVAPARPRNWIDAVNSQVALQPISVPATSALQKAKPATLQQFYYLKGSAAPS